MKNLVSRYLFALLIVTLVAGALPAQGAILTLSDSNSVVSIDDASQAGVFQWKVDGVNQLAQQWFWYRTGGTGNAEQSVDTLSAPTISGTSANGVTLTYAQPSGLSVKLRYVLTGGASGSQTSDLTESITLTNSSAQPMDLHFFQYSDFDLNGIAGGDVVTFTNANEVDQSKVTGGSMETMAETVITPSPSRYESAFFPTTLNSLNDGTGTTLSNTAPLGVPLGPGDVTWAYQWDKTLAPGGQLIINKDKNISVSPVPEPGTLVMLGVSAVGLFVYGKRLRKRAAQ